MDTRFVNTSPENLTAHEHSYVTIGRGHLESRLRHPHSNHSQTPSSRWAVGHSLFTLIKELTVLKTCVLLKKDHRVPTCRVYRISQSQAQHALKRMRFRCFGTCIFSAAG